MESLPPVDLTSKGSAVLEDGVAQHPVNLTGKIPTVLVDGIVQDPCQQREVYAETSMHAPVTKKSVKLWRGKKSIKFKLRGGRKYKKLMRGNTLDMVTLEEKAQRLVLENRKLEKRITELRTLNTKANDEITELLEQYSADRRSWMDSSNQLADSIREMARWTGLISAVLEDGIAEDPEQQSEGKSEVSRFIYKVDDAETDGHAPVTERLSRGNIHMVTVEEIQQLTLENGKLNKLVIKLLNLNAKAQEKFDELLGEKRVERKEWKQQFFKLVEEKDRMMVIQPGLNLFHCSIQERALRSKQLTVGNSIRSNNIRCCLKNYLMHGD